MNIRHSSPARFITGTPAGVDLAPRTKHLRELIIRIDGKDLCIGCGLGQHEPETSETSCTYKGYTYHSPFFCICCGIQICYPQFAFARHCGYCDTGLCQRDIDAIRMGARR